MKIGELASRSGVATKTIRFYEDAGVLPTASRNRSGYRDYGQEALDRLEFVRRAQAAGLSLREIAGIVAIREGGSTPCEHVEEVLSRHLARVRGQLAELVALEGHLMTLLDRARTGPDSLKARHEAAVCWILEDTTA